MSGFVYHECAHTAGQLPFLLRQKRQPKKGYPDIRVTLISGRASIQLSRPQISASTA